MKIFIPSKDRFDVINNGTSSLFPEAVVVVHNARQETLYKRAGIPNPIIVSDTEPNRFGKSLQMKYVMENFVKMGEWVVFADDNLSSITAVHPSHYAHERFPEMEGKDARLIYRTKVDNKRMRDIFAEMIFKAEAIGANYCGFASNGNYYFRKKKWQYVGWVIGQLFMMKRTHIQIPICHQDDTYLTAEHLKHDGIILINKFVFPSSPHYRKGGHGTVAERYLTRVKEVKELLVRYGGLFSVKNPKRMPKNQDVKLALRTLGQVADWRKTKFGLG